MMMQNCGNNISKNQIQNLVKSIAPLRKEFNEVSIKIGNLSIRARGPRDLSLKSRSTSATQKPRSQRPASTSGIKSPRHTTKQLHTISYRLHGWKRKVFKKCVFRAFRANVISSRSTPINVAMLSPKAKEFVPSLPTAENSRALRSKNKTNL